MIHYENSKVAVDLVVFTIIERKLHVFLQLREKEPYKGMHELIGGLLLKNETAEDTVHRKLKETVLTEKFYLQQFYTFTQPLRDPRERVVSIGFVAFVNENYVHTRVQWHAFDDLPKLGFDHNSIIHAAYQHLKKNLNSDMVKSFLPAKFPLNQLQLVHEVINNESYDNRNFRKKILSEGLVQETKEREGDVSHRPAILYRFT